MRDQFLHAVQNMEILYQISYQSHKLEIFEIICNVMEASSKHKYNVHMRSITKSSSLYIY